MAQKLRWGLLSTAKINRAIIPPLRASKRSQLTTVASRSHETAGQYAREHDIPNFYGSYEELLADPNIDVIYNSLPNHLHAEWTIKALQAGKHVLLEKPLALTTAEVAAIGEAAHKAGRVVAEAFMYRHHPQTLKVQQLLAEGAIGELKWINGYFTFKLDREGNYRWDERYGGGSLWDIGCYPVSYARMAVGQAPNQVMGWQTFTAEGADLTFSGQMVYPGGVTAQFYSSFDLPFQTLMELHGTEGTLTISQPFAPRDPRIPLLLKGKDGSLQRFTFRKMDVYQGEVMDIESAILDGTPPRISLLESNDNIATIQALYQAARLHGAAVNLPA